MTLPVPKHQHMELRSEQGFIQDFELGGGGGGGGGGETGW